MSFTTTVFLVWSGGVRRYQNKDGSLTTAGKYAARKVRGHAGPGQYITRKRQLAGDKRDLEYLNKGGHLSVGFTKKRQAAYDARDKKILENRIKLNKQNNKKEKKKLTKGQKIAIGTAAVAAALGGTAYAINKKNTYTIKSTSTGRKYTLNALTRTIKPKGGPNFGKIKLTKEVMNELKREILLGKK